MQGLLGYLAQGYPPVYRQVDPLLKRQPYHQELEVDCHPSSLVSLHKTNRTLLDLIHSWRSCNASVPSVEAHPSVNDTPLLDPAYLPCPVAPAVNDAVS